MTVDSSEILSQDDVRDNKIRLIFTHTTSEGKVLGPFVEHRPEDEVIEEFLAGSRLLLESSLNQPPPDEEGEFLEFLLQHGDQVILSALEIDRAKLDALKTKAEDTKGDTKGDEVIGIGETGGIEV